MIERTFDYRIVKRITGSSPLVSNQVYYMIDGDNLWTLHDVDDDLMIHANMNTKKGKFAIESAKSCFNWIFENTDYKKIVAHVPKENRKACIIASLCMNLVKVDHRHHYEVRRNV